MVFVVYLVVECKHSKTAYLGSITLLRLFIYDKLCKLIVIRVFFIFLVMFT